MFKNFIVKLNSYNLYVIIGQKYEKTIGDKAKADMIKFTARKPQERFDKIENCIQNIFKHNEDENLRDFEIRIDPKMMIVDGYFYLSIYVP